MGLASSSRRGDGLVSGRGCSLTCFDHFFRGGQRGSLNALATSPCGSSQRKCGSIHARRHFYNRDCVVIAKRAPASDELAAQSFDRRANHFGAVLRIFGSEPVMLPEYKRTE